MKTSQCMSFLCEQTNVLGLLKPPYASVNGVNWERVGGATLPCLGLLLRLENWLKAVIGTPFYPDDMITIILNLFFNCDQNQFFYEPSKLQVRSVLL